MVLAVIGLILGLILGIMVPWSIPLAYSKLFSIALLASLDSVFGGVRAALDDVFDAKSFIFGFFSNSLLAAFLVYVGDNLSIDLYYVALLAFGMRIFRNLGRIRRFLVKKT